MRRFFVDAPARVGRISTVTGQEARHMVKTLRMGPGEEVLLYDPAGGRYRAVIQQARADQVVLDVLERLPGEEPPPGIDAAVALTKSGKMDFVVRALTELGIRRILPFTAVRSVSRPEGKKLDAKVARWQKIALEAVKQCGRPDIPRVLALPSPADLARMAPDYPFKVVFYEGRKEPAPLAKPAEDTPSLPALFVIGPEGGFEEKEILELNSAGFATASLGPRILRAETATLAAATLMQHVIGDLSNR